MENVYRPHVMNATETDQRFNVTVSGLPRLAVTSDNELTVPATQARSLVVRAQLPPDVAPPGSHPIKFEIESIDMNVHDAEKSVFLVPN